MAIAKKIENTPILPNFNTDPFLTILEGSYAFVSFCFSTMNIYPSKWKKFTKWAFWKKLFQFWS